jgi:hypothetical protein
MTEIDVLLISSAALALWLFNLRRKSQLCSESSRRSKAKV